MIGCSKRSRRFFYIVALISGVLGVVVLGLKVFKVFPDDTVYTLISLVLLLFAFAMYLQPGMRMIKGMQKITQEYRQSFYEELSKDNPLIKDLTLFENESNELQYDNFVFANLEFNDALIIMESLVKEYVMIVYGVMDEKQRKIVKAKIENFIVTVNKKDGTTDKMYLIKDYLFKKR